MPKRNRINLLVRLAKRDDSWKCSYCKIQLLDVTGFSKEDIRLNQDSRYYPTVDHQIPLSRAGADHIDNMVISCDDCNQKKGDRTPEEFEQNIPAAHETVIDMLKRRLGV